MHVSPDELWAAVLAAAEKSALNTAIFTDTHREIVQLIGAFLQNEAAIKPIEPIIICGVPGTGKTTFLYLLDRILREQISLADNITATMTKANGRTHTVHKRHYLGAPLSLLSVSKWADLHHFYAWDTDNHRFDPAALRTFIRSTLTPMRVIFADEVETAGYSPTIPDMAKNGILVVGTSNQTQFRQLEQHSIPARVYQFGGADMRAGDPEDAVVEAHEAAWATFETAAAQPVQRREQLSFQTWRDDGQAFVRVELWNAVQTAMLDNEWIAFLQGEKGTADTLTLLIDTFSLEKLRTNYNGIIRFVNLFDAIEQLGCGVLVRNAAATPTLSREAINHMKVTIEMNNSLPDDIKRRTVVGIDRCTSRLGQAGHRAKSPTR